MNQEPKNLKHRVQTQKPKRSMDIAPDFSLSWFSFRPKPQTWFPAESQNKKLKNFLRKISTRPFVLVGKSTLTVSSFISRKLKKIFLPKNISRNTFTKLKNVSSLNLKTPKQSRSWFKSKLVIKPFFNKFIHFNQKPIFHYSSHTISSVKRKTRQTAFVKSKRKLQFQHSILKLISKPNFAKRKEINFKNYFQKAFASIKSIKLSKFKLRGIKKIFINPWSRKLAVALLLMIFVITNFFQNTQNTWGATYTFNQTDWSGGATANNAVHPTNTTGWNQYSSGTNVVTSTAGQATLSETTHTNFSETFTTTTYKDAVNTNANWNTGTGQVEMASESIGTNLYEKLNGVLVGNQINAQIKVGDDYYVGANSGKFLKYSSATDTVTDLTSKISSFWGSSNRGVYSLALDSTNNVIYLGGQNGNFARYNLPTYSGGGTYPTADTAYYLNTKTGAVFSGNNSFGIFSLAFDSANNVLYLGGYGDSFYGKFARYNTTVYSGGGTYPTANTGYDLSAKISSVFGSGAKINKLVFDSANAEIYLLGVSNFGRYSIGSDSFADLKGKTTSFLPTAGTGITMTAYGNGKIYGVDDRSSVRGGFFVYDIASGITTDLSAKISSILGPGNSKIMSIAYDTANEVVYLGSFGSIFIRYNTSSYTAGGTYGTADTVYDLTAKISSLWGGSTWTNAMAYDSANKVLYLGGNGNLLLRYNTTFNDGLDATYPTVDTAHNLSAKISGFWGGKYIGTLHYDETNKVLYLGGTDYWDTSFAFARYNTTSYTAGGTYGTADTGYNLTAKITALSWGSYGIKSFAYDSANNVLYLGGGNGKFARYNTTFNDGLDATYPTADTAHSLAGKISGFWSTSTVNSLAFDSANKSFYLAGGGKFARYNTTSYSAGGTYASANTAYDLTAKVSAYSSGLISVAFDGVNNIAYLGGSKNLVRYNTDFYVGGGSYPTADTAYDFSASLHSVNFFLLNATLYDGLLDSANKVLYFGVSGGYFGRYNLPGYTGGGTYPTTDTGYNLTSKISSFWSTNAILAMAFDSANGVVYLGGENGKFAKYTLGTDTGADLTAKISSFSSANAVNSLVFDSTNSVIYLGGAASKFAKYTVGTDTAADLTSKVNGVDWNGASVKAIVAANNNEIYIGSSNGKFTKYNTATGVATGLTSKVSSFWSTNSVNALVFDSVNNVVYLVGNGAMFARYNTSSYAGGGTYPTADTAYNLASKISAVWNGTNVLSLAFDSANNVLYLGGASSKFSRYNATFYTAGGTYPTADTVYDLSNSLFALVGTTAVYYSTIDSTNNVIYLGGTSGRFVRYNTTFYPGGGTYPTANTMYSLFAKVSSFIGNNIVSMSLDASNNVLYLAEDSGKFVRYNTTSYTGGGTYPTADTAYNLSAKISSFWGGNAIRTASFDSTYNVVYLGGDSGNFARYSANDDAGTNLRSGPDTLSFWSTNNINTLAIGGNGYYYIGGDLGYFAEKAPVTSFTEALSTAVDSVAYDIFYATLTKNDTPGSGSAQYFLSNNGGANWNQVTPGSTYTFSTTGSDLRFKARVSGNATVQDVTISYWSYNTSGSIISSKYNSTDAAAILAKLQWAETLESNTDVKFQLRTSADGNTWTNWCGPDNGNAGTCDSGTYFTAPTGTETVDNLMTDQANDQWFQYQATLTSDGKLTPMLSDLTITYVVNATPQVQNVSASQGTDGLVTVSYEVRDADTTTGSNTPNRVAIALQYCTANCSNVGSETWATATAVSGNVGSNIPVQEASWTSYQLVWNPTTDYDNQYNATNFKVRIRANDGELANNLGYGNSGTFVLDTSEPTLQSTTLLIDNSASAVQKTTSGITLKMQNISGNTATENVYAQFSRDGGSTWYGANGDGTLAAAGNWGTGFALNNLAGLSWAWTMNSRSETITVRIKDSYGNIQSATDTNSVQYNAYPEVQSVSASQGTDGLVTVDYEVRDTDTTNGLTPNTLAITLQYCTANCSTPGGETWTDAATATGDGSGISVTEGGWTAHQIVWTAKTDYDNQYNGTNFKVRVKADDSGPINALDYAESAIFILDTKNPTSFSFAADHKDQNFTLTLTTPTDDSSFQMAVSEIPNTFSSFGAFSSPYVYTSSTADPATIYVRVKDAYGNYRDVSVTTPARPMNPIYFDISSAAQGTYQEFISWDVVSAVQSGSGFASYQIYRKIDSGSFTLLDTITDRTLNYYLDVIKDENPLTDDSDPTFDPNNPSTYYYKVETVDTNNDRSVFSGEVVDIPNGTGGSDSTPPTISNVQVSSITTTSAIVTWETDELANSSVGYSEDYTYLPERGLASYETTGHSIALTGLIPGTNYNIKVKSYDAMGNLGEVCFGGVGCSPGSNNPTIFSFSTLEGPAIFNVRLKESSNNQATISWETDEDSDSHVIYSDTVAGGNLVNAQTEGSTDYVDGGYPYLHEVTLTGLTQSTPYYFYVESEGASGTATLMNITADPPYFSFLTGNDNDAPVISDVNTIIISNSEAAINWVTDEPADSKVEYKADGEQYSDHPPVTIATYDKSHYVILTGLLSNNHYTFQITSKDINGNETTQNSYEFTTLRDPGEQHPPLSSISSISDPPSVLTDTKAVISFTTDQAAECTIEFGTATGNYNEIPVVETGYNESHAMRLNGLLFSTKYYYQISCEDNLGTVVSSTEYSFTTLEKQYTESGIGDLIDSTAPTISGVSVEVTSGESVTVTWSTNELASSYIRYGIESGTYTDMAGDPLVNYATESDPKANYAEAHTVIINGLVPNIQYYFTALSVDEAGNIAESGEENFTTGASSSISGIEFSSLSLGEVEITWNTGAKISSIVEYGLTETLGQRREDTAKVTEHSITISRLTAGQKYLFRISGEDETGKLYSSSDQYFTPKSPPQASGVKVENISDRKAEVVFITSAPAQSLVTYASADGQDSGSKGKPELSTSHRIGLEGLKPGTQYTFTVQVSDEDGNTSEETGEGFTTSKDEQAPEIQQTRTDSALSQNEKVQTIISWATNEPSTTELQYREGLGGEEKEAKVNQSMVKEHTAIITTFAPGKVYYFKIKSTDESGNTALSKEYALLTPKRKENIVQIIIQTFEGMFSWARR